MPEPYNNATSIEDQLAKILGDYLEAHRAGNAPPKDEILRQYPELADDLSNCLASLEFVQVAGIRPTDDDVPETEGLAAIGDFKIVREIGRGGMGVVYEAIQISLGRRVALKVLPLAAMLNDCQKARFQNEAHAVGLLVHDNIVPIYQVGCDRGVHYYAMQFVDGRTLADLIGDLQKRHSADSKSTVRLSHRDQETEIANGRAKTTSSAVLATTGDVLSHRSSEFFRVVAKIGMQSASALQHAHEMGVVHRDIKPTNLLMDAKAKVWVADFGLAHVESDAGLTCSGDILGTARYMSPEQAVGSPLIDHRTDIFSLGMTLYELATLNHASPGDDRVKIIRQICEDEPKAPRLHNDRIPAELETIILKALEKNPGDRYQSAGEFEADLQRFLDDRPILAKRPTLTQRVSKWTRRNRAVATTAVVSAFLLLLAVTTVSLVALNRLSKSERRSTERLYESYLHQAATERSTLNPNRRSESLASVGEAAVLMSDLKLDKDPEQLLRVRNAMISSLTIPLDVRTVANWAHPTPNYLSSFDGDMTEYAIYDHNAKQTIFRDARNNAELARLPKGETPEESKTLSPDGRFVGYLLPAGNHKYKARVWDRSQSLRIIDDVPIQSLGGSSIRFEYTSDSKRLWLSPHGELLRAYDLPTGELHTEIDLTQFGAYGSNWIFRVSPDGEKLALAYGNTIKILDLVTNAIEEFPKTQSPMYPAMSWSDDGRYLATICQDRFGYVWDVRSKTRTTVLAGAYTRGVIRFNAAATMLATHRRGGLTVIWDAMTGRELFSMRGRFSRFSRRGNELAWNTSHRSGIWQITESNEFRVFQAIGSHEVFTASKVGASLVVAGCDDGLRIWCRHTGKLLGVIPSLGRTFACYHSSSNSVVTNSANGLQRWPVAQSQAGISLGPPELMATNASSHYFDIAQSRNGSVLLARSHVGPTPLLLYDMTTRRPRGQIPAHNNARFVSLSPNGNLAAAGSWHGLKGHGLWIWDVKTRGQVHQLYSQPGHVGGNFSPCGQWFVLSTGNDYTAYDTTSWNECWRIPRDGTNDAPGPVAFTADSELVTVRTNDESIKLVRVASGEIVAELEDPYRLASVSAEFSDDGRCLLEPVFNMVRMWDIAAIRERLGEMGLDWTGPAIASTEDTPAPVAKVAILLDAKE